VSDLATEQTGDRVGVRVVGGSEQQVVGRQHAARSKRRGADE
jgi:hypothetical protein